MLQDAILDFIDEQARAGQEELAHTISQLVQRRAPACYERMSHASHDAFLEPAVFAWLTAQRDDLDPYHTLYGALPLWDRPRRLQVTVDSQGRVYLPSCGYLEGLVPNSATTVERSLPEAPFLSAGQRINFVPAQRLESHHLEISHHMDTFLRPFFAAASSSAPDATALGSADAQRATVLCARALARLERLCPAIYKLLRIANRRIHLYRSTEPNSFAALSIHGAAFFNVPVQASEVFFLDDFAHQGGHVVFNAATLNQSRYLRRCGETPLREIGADPADSRTLYAAFHGLFTYSLILTVLSACFRSGVVETQDAHELRGRIAFYLLKFRIDLENLAQSGLLAQDGRYLYQGFLACYESVLAELHGAVQGLDLSNQGYVFDYGHFTALAANRAPRG